MGMTRGGRREALGPQALHHRNRQLPAGEGSISNSGADLGVNQPLPGRGATTPPGAYSDAPKALRANRLASQSGLSLEGERGAQDQGGRRRGPADRDGRTQGPDCGIGGRGEERQGRAGQGQGGSPENPCFHGISG